MRTSEIVGLREYRARAHQHWTADSFHRSVHQSRTTHSSVLAASIKLCRSQWRWVAVVTTILVFFAFGWFLSLPAPAADHASLAIAAASYDRNWVLIVAVVLIGSALVGCGVYLIRNRWRRLSGTHPTQSPSAASDEMTINSSVPASLV